MQLAAYMSCDQICDCLGIIRIEEGLKIFFTILFYLIDTLVTTGIITVVNSFLSFSVVVSRGSSYIGIWI